MKALLLLLLLVPVILPGQTRRQEVVDSIRAAAATNLQDVSELLKNNPISKVRSIRVTDTGDYVTISVRVRIAEPILVAVLPYLAVSELKTGSKAIAMTAMDVPPIPVPAEEPGVIPVVPLAQVASLAIKCIPVKAVDTAVIPDIPEPETAENIIPLSITPLRIRDIVLKSYTAAIHAIPEPNTAEPLSTLPIVEVKIKAIAAPKMNTQNVPVLTEPEIWDDIELSDAIKLKTELARIRKPDTVSIIIFEEKRMPVEGMHLSDEGYSLLEKLEGFSPDLYSLKDGGFTIGFGFFIPYGEGRAWNKGVTWEDAERMIRQKVPNYEDQVKEYINVPLTQNEFDALTMLAYNLGGFSKATSIVNDINSQADFYKLQSDWKRFVHSKAPGVTRGLMNRRRDEIEVRNESNYQPERKIQVLKNRN